MAFEFKGLTEKQYLSDMTKEVNRVGDYLKNELTKEDVETVDSPDFEDILKYINVTGNYYVTTSKNQPKGENWNGFVFFEKRNNNSYKIYFNPFNNENLYLRTYSNGTLTDWQKFVLDEETNNWQKYKFTNEQGQYTTQEDVDIRELNNSKTIYVKNLVDPPKPELNEGWLDTKVHENGNTSITTFNPINSTIAYTKMQKRAREVQNPNLLRDSLFTGGKYSPIGDVRIEDDGKYPYWGFHKFETSISDNKYKGQNAVLIKDNKTRYPTVMGKRLTIGKEVQIGEKLTMSVYVKVNDINKIEEGVYFELAGYNDISTVVNETIGRKWITKDEVVEGWARYSFTTTVPSETPEGTQVKYISALLRLDTGDKNNGLNVYYALPKLEKGDKATPFITHVDDKVQFDEIYTNWLENPDEQSILNNYTTDINNDNYFKYTFWKNEVGDMTLQDLLQTLPQGFHTFYAQGGIEGTPKGKSVRGTVQVDNDNGDIKESRKFINVQFTDYYGLNYSLYYDDNRFNSADTQVGWSPLRQTEQATNLWDGEFDLGEVDKTITLKDDINNYDCIDVEYWTVAAGHRAVKRLKILGEFNYYIRDFNMGNDSASLWVTFFEGYFQTNGKTLTAKMSKRLNTYTTEIESFNNPGSIRIYRITGINTI